MQISKTQKNTSTRRRIKLLLAALLVSTISFAGSVPAQAVGILTFTITYSTSGSSGGSAPAPESFNTLTDATSVDATVTSYRGSLYKLGYDFRGWTTGSGGGGDFYLAGETITLTSDITLYPAFGGTVFYAAFGGNGSPEDTTVDYIIGRPFTLSLVGTLTRPTYKFLGWRKDVASKSYQTAGASYTVSNSSTADFNMYATWGRSISFNINGATVGSAPEELLWVDGDVPLTLKSPSQLDLQKRGFFHSGWATTSSGGAISNSFIPSVADQVLYAAWIAQPTNSIYRFDFKPGKKVLTDYSVTRLNRMLKLLNPNALFPKQKIVVFLKSKRYVTQPSSLGKARINVIRRALKDAGIVAEVVWSNETRSSGSAKLAQNNRVISTLKWVN